MTKRMESEEMKQYMQQELELDKLDEMSLRAILDSFVERYMRVSHCREPRSWVRAAEDIEELKLRSGSMIIGDSDAGGVYLPVGVMGSIGNEECVNCHWYAIGGIGYVQDGKSIFFCYNPDCKKAADEYGSDRKKQKLEAHVATGQCKFSDYVAFTPKDFCTNKADGEDQLCSMHRGVKCSVCQRQAVRMHWEFGSLAYSYPRCGEH
jgi:hypothetical protein